MFIRFATFNVNGLHDVTKMKNVLLLLILILLGWSSDAFSQVVDMKNVTANLKSGDIQNLVKSFGDIVELNLDGDRKEVAKSESIAILKSFLSKHPASNLELKHEGSSGSSSFIIGEFSHNGDTYRVMIKGDDKIKRLDVTKK